MQPLLTVSIRRTWVISWLAGTLLAVGFPAFGQAPMTLSDGLKKLNQKRGVYSLYDPQVIDNHRVSTLPDWKADTELDEVILMSDVTEQAGSNPQTSQHALPIALVRSAPTVAGEKDVLKSLQFLPGVQKGLDGQVDLTT